ncbi:MAG: hypothetical protein A2V81_00190 [Candidatus Abawacabacteria bacterium RBG_16_42_10]|uniref:Damage-inducible protein J n=1 Tax=Candidatus Abawacabacteria bacterium RBG_16_42_10 TaxID=1817814 RepID=A0A1F4XLC8_9BACT|nr:MAG: hypothetical protein A2V81_00190 [Candidatus Abawacabacteria bacterium RBG_16_42_10]
MSSVINVKIDPKVKAEAKKVAAELGISLSALINGYLRQLIKSKTVYLSLHEEPSPYLIEAIRESKEDIKKGRVKKFENVDDAIKFLKKL